MKKTLEQELKEVRALAEPGGQLALDRLLMLARASELLKEHGPIHSNKGRARVMRETKPAGRPSPRFSSLMVNPSLVREQNERRNGTMVPYG